MKDIAVFVDPRRVGDDLLRFAAGMAKKKNARLLGIYVASDPPLSHGFARGGAAIGAMIESAVIRENRTATGHRRRFLDVASQYNATASFRTVWSDSDVRRRIVVNSLLADVVIVGKEAPHSLPGHWRPDKFLALCDAPLLLVPAGSRGETAPRHVVIAWNASKESRRAVADAMPLLAMADQVDVLVIDEDDQFGVDAALHLARHGIRARVRLCEPMNRPVADAILSEVSGGDADLLVMGAYSHGWAARRMFGSVTESVVARATVPVFLSR